MIKTINVNEFQAKISQVLQDVQDGDTYEIMRYSKPFAAVVSYDEYLKLKGECKRCIEDLRKIAQSAKRAK